MTAPVVTLSASYGAGGSVVGPQVADALGVPFMNRAIPVEVSGRLAVPLEETLMHDGRSDEGITRMLASFAGLAAAEYPSSASTYLSEWDFKRATEEAITGCAREGAVILGRAGACVLADRPGALHVRLDGPAPARVKQACEFANGEMTEDQARSAQRDADRARNAYVRHFYGADPTDAGLYHLVIDSTALDLDACVETIAAAARARAAKAPAGA